MYFSRSERAFFHRPETMALVERISQQGSLVVYAGAGVSIDRTGLSWQDLVERLLARHIPEPELRQAIMDTHTPLQASSVVGQYYANMYGDRWKDYVHRDLRAVLYSGRIWQRGELSNAIVRLAAAFARKGSSFSVITTNYDMYIEEAAEHLQGIKDPSIEGLDLNATVVDHDQEVPNHDLAQHTGPNRLVYLHGYLTKDGTNEQGVILGEPEYSRSYALSHAILREHLDKSSVIIIGSSLTDAPLLDALAATHKSSGNGQHPRMRLAIIPLQGIRFPEGSGAAVIDQVTNGMAMRMRRFGVECVFTDFFCQVPQLLTEVQISLDRCSGSRRYALPGTKVRYGVRLATWWRDWWNAHEPGIEAKQARDHKLLRNTLAELVEILEAKRETMKLETWLRWSPEESGPRVLRLWAASTGTWPDIDAMHQEDIRADSENVAIDTFCLGRPEIHPAKSDHDRWRTYLCVPIKIGAEHGELPVGVISLASKTDMKGSKINEKHGTILYDAIEKMREIGIQVASPPKRRQTRTPAPAKAT